MREKAFREMKKDVGMTTAQKSKETRRMEMGSIFVLCSVYPANNPYIYVRRVASVVMYVRICRDCWLDIQNKEQRLIPFPSFLFPYFFEQWSSLHLFSFHEILFPLLYIM